jgi:hypothetical protein
MALDQIEMNMWLRDDPWEPGPSTVVKADPAGNSAASARQPQKYNQKPHQAHFGSDYGIYTGCRELGTGAVP